MLKQIKILHTVIWVVMASACIYVLYAGITNTSNALTWFCVGLIVLEGIVLLLNKGTCPLTPMASRYTTKRSNNFDIYLPEWLPKNNKQIFTTIFLAGVLLIMLRRWL